jgi:hypothetical protein
MVVAALSAMLAGVSVSDAAPARADDPSFAPPPPPPPPHKPLDRLPPPEPDCSKQFVIESARGSTETVDSDDFGDNHINSRYVSAVTSDLIVNEGVNSGDIAQYNVNYSAGGFPGYSFAVGQGVENLKAEIHRYVACGPNRPTLILIGYSEGADVIKKTLNDIASTPDADTIGAAINIADPTRSNDNAALAASGHMNTVNPDWTPAPQPDPNEGGVLERRPVSSPFADDGRYFDLCRGDDIVCNTLTGPVPEEQQADSLAAQAVAHLPAHHSYAVSPNDLVDRITHGAIAAAEAQRNNTHPAPPPPPNATHPASSTPSVTGPSVTGPSVTGPSVTGPSGPPQSGPPQSGPPLVSLAPPPMRSAPPPPPGSVAPPPPDKGVPGPTVHQEEARGHKMNIRRFATTDARVVAVLKGPATIDVQCQVHGQRVIYGRFDNDGWSYLPAFGGWISNIFISGNKMVPRVPNCHSTKAPKIRADVPHAMIPKPVIPAPEVLKPAQTLLPPLGTPQPPGALVPTPTTPAQPPVRIGNDGLL